MPIERYNAAEAEARWQKVWDERGIFATPYRPGSTAFAINNGSPWRALDGKNAHPNLAGDLPILLVDVHKNAHIALVSTAVHR